MIFHVDIQSEHVCFCRSSRRRGVKVVHGSGSNMGGSFLPVWQIIAGDDGKQKLPLGYGWNYFRLDRFDRQWCGKSCWINWWEFGTVGFQVQSAGKYNIYNIFFYLYSKSSSRQSP